MENTILSQVLQIAANVAVILLALSICLAVAQSMGWLKWLNISETASKKKPKRVRANAKKALKPKRTAPNPTVPAAGKRGRPRKEEAAAVV